MEPFIAEIRIMACNFAPVGWAQCNGQLLSISQNTALFSLLGTTYGGDGRSTFGLPDLRAASPLGVGQGPGLSDYFLGETGGQATVALDKDELPMHMHALNASATAATTGTPSVTANLAVSSIATYGAAQNLVPMAPVGAPATAHNNRQPYLSFMFCIALQGVFPARS